MILTRLAFKAGMKKLILSITLLILTGIQFSACFLSDSCHHPYANLNDEQLALQLERLIQSKANEAKVKKS